MWGSEENPYNLLVDGKSFSVRRNLYEFLLIARERRWRTWFWIDAICIDRSNIEERNHQVRQMASIYHSAFHVIIWAGPISNANAVAQMIRLGKLIPNRSAYSCFQGTEPILFRCLLRKRTQVLGELAAMEYWSRLWIVQEITLARRAFVVLDSRLIPWERFRSTIWEIYKTDLGYDDARNYELPVHHFINLIRTSLFSRVCINDLLVKHKSSKCADRRDGVYGLLGLASGAQGFVIDYQRTAADLLFAVVDHFELSVTTDKPVELIETQLSCITQALELELAGVCQHYVLEASCKSDLWLTLLRGRYLRTTSDIYGGNPRGTSPLDLHAMVFDSSDAADRTLWQRLTEEIHEASSTGTYNLNMRYTAKVLLCDFCDMSYYTGRSDRNGGKLIRCN
jgi:hypothetical protein